MKNLKYILILFALSLVSCEEVIDLDLNTAEPKLVIEASINLFPGETVINQARVRLTTTAPFFDTEIPIVTDATVSINDENGIVFPFFYEENGYYTADLEPQLNTLYTIQIIYQNEIYTGSTQLVTSPPYNGNVEQNIVDIFGETNIELKAYFNDPEDETNFYFYIGQSIHGKLYDTFNDSFFNGNQMFTSYTSENLKPGDNVTFTLFGINQNNYNYYFNLLLQTENAAFGPFETQPATVRGNIVNQTNPDNFPLGYFRISEAYSLTYTVQ